MRTRIVLVTALLCGMLAPAPLRADRPVVAQVFDNQPCAVATELRLPLVAR